MCKGQQLPALLLWLGGPASGLVPEGQLQDLNGHMGPQVLQRAD